MLLTDVWMALEYTNEEPPIHIIMRPVAKFFGQEFPEPKKKRKNGKRPGMATQVSPHEIAPMMAIAGQPKSGELVPKHIRNSPTLKRMFAKLENPDA